MNAPGVGAKELGSHIPLEYLASFICTSLLSLLGDGFLVSCACSSHCSTLIMHKVWRATVIWNHSRMLRWLPIAVLTCSLGL